MCHSGSKVESEFDKYHLSRIPDAPYSPDISLFDFWFSGLLKGILKDREPNSLDAIEEVVAEVWLHF
jgi:hypothetical protein